MTVDAPIATEQTAGTDSNTDKDYYAGHLGVIDQSNPVIASQDIVNSRGVLLAKQGSRIDLVTAKKLIQHRLTKPIESQIILSQSITVGCLQKSFNQLLKRYPDVNGIHVNLKFHQDFNYLLGSWRIQPVLAQKLTVFQERMPPEFEKALFSAWLSALLAREMGMDIQSQHAVMLGGLLHDYGFLHINPDVLHKTGELNSAEWRAIQSHTIIGKTLSETITDLDKRVPRIILEHHERSDGLGYPSGKHTTELDLLGQIVAMADSIQAIRAGKFAHTGRILRDLDPFLNMNTDVHTHRVYESACSILRKSGLVRTALPHCAGQDWLIKLHLRWQGLSKIVSFLETLTELVAAIDVGAPRGKLTRVFNRLLVITNQSGLLAPELGQWLTDLQQSKLEPAVQIELGDIELMLDELSWQIKNAKRAVDALFDAHPNPTLPAMITLKSMTNELINVLNVEAQN